MPCDFFYFRWCSQTTNLRLSIFIMCLEGRWGDEIQACGEHQNLSQHFTHIQITLQFCPRCRTEGYTWSVGIQMLKNPRSLYVLESRFVFRNNLQLSLNGSDPEILQSKSTDRSCESTVLLSSCECVSPSSFHVVLNCSIRTFALYFFQPGSTQSTLNTIASIAVVNGQG